MLPARGRENYNEQLWFCFMQSDFSDLKLRSAVCFHCWCVWAAGSGEGSAGTSPGSGCSGFSVLMRPPLARSELLHSGNGVTSVITYQLFGWNVINQIHFANKWLRPFSFAVTFSCLFSLTADFSLLHKRTLSVWGDQSPVFLCSNIKQPLNITHPLRWNSGM